jgi:signal transduction histidine kinase
MKFLPLDFLKSIRVKFGLLIAFLLLIVFTLSSGILIYRNINTQNQNLVSQARAFARLSVQPIGDTYSLYYDSGYLKFTELIKKPLSLNSDITRVQIISVNGQVLFDSNNLQKQEPTENKEEVTADILDKVRLNQSSEIVAAGDKTKPVQIIEPYFEDFGAHQFSILYFVSYESVAKNVAATIGTSVLLSTVFLIISIILIFIVVGRTIINPMEKVAAGSRLIKSGDFSHNIEVKNNDEIGDLAAAVNQMAATLKKNIVDLKELDKLKDEFVFLASHNLRTPITVIKGYIGLLQKDKLLDIKSRNRLDKMLASTKELELLAESLLNLASLEYRDKRLLISDIDLVKIIEETTENFGKEAAKKGISFILELPQFTVSAVQADRERIKQALENVIENAVKFNKEGGKVIIKLEEKGKELLLSISDTGIGISKEEGENIFRKFHRATSVLMYDYEGIGLGLYVAKLIIEAHQGKIWFESTPGVGTTFYITLPVKEEHSKG